MQAESLEVLEKADVAPAQARAIVRAIEIEIAGTKDVLATKADVALLRQEMSELRLEVKGDLLRLETKLEGKINDVASSITPQMYGDPRPIGCPAGLRLLLRDVRSLTA